MNLLPKSSGTRPRVACEISPQGVVAARSADATGPLSAVAREALPDGAVAPSLKPGNVVDRVAVTAALRRAMEGIGLRANSRGADTTLIIPDPAVRVLLLDFDALPGKLSEALPLVRFRLKKLLPFDADEAMVTFQIMSSGKSGVRVLAVAIPRDVLSDYETVAREAGFEPGAILPSTLATLPAVDDSDGPVLIVNASRAAVTTAIVRSGILLLHRSMDLQEHSAATPANLPPALFEPSAAALPLVDREQSAAEWAAQEPLPEHGRNPYADRQNDEAAVQNEDGITGYNVPRVFAEAPVAYRDDVYGSPGDPAHSPYTADTVSADLNAEVHHAALYAPIASPAENRLSSVHMALTNAGDARGEMHVHPAYAEEVAQAVSVAAAYFEDTLSVAPRRVFSAGPLGATGLGQILAERGIAQEDGLSVRELVESAALLSDAVSSSVPRGWLAGVLGALRG